MNCLKEYDIKLSSERSVAFNDLKEYIIRGLQTKSPAETSAELYQVIKTLPASEFVIEYTSDFSSIDWQSYKAILHINVSNKIEKLVFDLSIEKLFQLVKNAFKDCNLFPLIYSNFNIYIVESISIDLPANLMPEPKIFNLPSNVSVDSLKKALEDANLFMKNENYSSALDRIHTFFCGYIRETLDKNKIEYNNSDTLNQLFKKLYSFYADKYNLDEHIITIFKSLTGTITAINDLRNWNSLSHPNYQIISNSNAKFVISAVELLVNYLQDLNC